MNFDWLICVLANIFRAKTMKTSYIWSFGCGPETSIARSKNYAEQIHLSLDETILNPVILAKVTKNFFGKVNNSLFYKLLE